MGKSSRKRSHDSPSPTSSSSASKKRASFSSYKDTPNLPPKVKIICEIIANTPALDVEKIIGATGIRVSQEEVEQVLKLSYAFPGAAVKFFRWAGYQLHDKHSPYAWNLVVDLLGKNGLFDAMWDAIKSMKKEGLLSLATFASVFSSYVIGDRVQEAIMTFEVMDQYGCPRDIMALNSLISAICRDGKPVHAYDFLNTVKHRIRPDADTYAILLEGWENERDVTSARQTFADMVMDIGWDPTNVPAYDSFLTTLLHGYSDGLRDAIKFFQTIRDNRCTPGIKFFKVALDKCSKKNDAKAARMFWEAVTDRNSGFTLDTDMYNLMIALQCSFREDDLARRLLDEMVFNGVFPDFQTYSVMFHCLIKSRRLKEASSIFAEMTRNEFVPTLSDCTLALKVYIESGDPQMPIKIWKCMLQNYKKGDLEEAGNLLITGLKDINRLPEAVKYAEDMVDRRIKLNSSTLSKLKTSLTKAGKTPVYDELLKKWKYH